MLQIVVNLVILTFVYLLISFSFVLVHGILRFFHIAHAISITLGAYFMYTAVVLWKLPLLMSLIIAIATIVVLMLMINKWIYKPLQEKKVENWQMMIASLGLNVVLQNIVSLIWKDSVLSFRYWDINVGYDFCGVFISNIQIVIVGVGAFLLLVCHFFLLKTNVGKQIKAMSLNSELSCVIGISKNKTVVWSMALGTVLAVSVGVLIAADIDMTPTMGFDWLMYGVVAMIIGGMGKMRYMIFGALLLATAQQLSAYFLDSKWMNATAYIILVVFLYFRPFGFSGKKLKKTEV